MAEVGISQSWS